MPAIFFERMNRLRSYTFVVILYGRECLLHVYSDILSWRTFSCNFQKEFPTYSYFYTKLLKHACVRIVRGFRPKAEMLCVWPVKINVPVHCGLSYARSDTVRWMHTDVFYQKEHFDRWGPSRSSMLFCARSNRFYNYAIKWSANIWISMLIKALKRTVGKSNIA